MYRSPGQPRRRADRTTGHRSAALVRGTMAKGPPKRGRMSVALSNTDLILAALLIASNGALSLALGLRLELPLAFAAIRLAVQLAVIGFILRFVFAQSSPLWTAAVALLMLLVA